MTADNLAFELAQTLRENHCDRKEESHKCVGSMTVACGKIELNCHLCGQGSEIPGWTALTAMKLESIFNAAGISWESLSLPTQIEAIKAYEKGMRT